MVLETIQRKRPSLRLVAEVRRFASNRSGTTAIEYALVATLVGAALIAGVSILGDGLIDFFGTFLDDLGA